MAISTFIISAFPGGRNGQMQGNDRGAGAFVKNVTIQNDFAVQKHISLAKIPLEILQNRGMIEAESIL